MLTFVGVNFVFNQQPNVWMDVGFMFVYYGLYFGVLGRDISEICADKMAANIGVRSLIIFYIKKTLIFRNIYIISNVYLFLTVLYSTRNAFT